MSPRYFLDAFVSRPTVGALGDLVAGAETQVRASIWDKELKEVIAADGELFTVTAAGYFPPETDIKRRDRVRLADGRKYEVIRVIIGISDRGIHDHTGVQLRDVD